MNSSRIERLLLEYSNISERKRELQSKIKENESRKKETEDTLKSTYLKFVPKGSNIGDSVFNAVKLILDEFQTHLDYYYGQLRILNDCEKAMYEALKCLDKRENDVIYWRYIKGHKWEVVSVKTSYSRSQCFEIRDVALEKLVQNYKE